MMDVAYTILYTIYNTRGHDVENVAMKTEKIFVERMNKKTFSSVWSYEIFSPM